MTHRCLLREGRRCAWDGAVCHRQPLFAFRRGASRTFGTAPVDDRLRVVGFYSLAASSVKLEDAPGKVRRNMPEPIPVILLGRLAVDTRRQGSGLGASLLQDAVRRVAGIADDVGVRALLVHAIDEPAARSTAASGSSLHQWTTRPCSYRSRTSRRASETH